MAREKLFMLKNLQIQERWSNQKKLKASSDGPEIVSQTNCENVQSRNELRVGVQKYGFRLFQRAVYDARAWRHGCAGKNFTDELLMPDRCYQIWSLVVSIQWEL